jgi:hypothetical protein
VYKTYPSSFLGGQLTGVNRAPEWKDGFDNARHKRTLPAVSSRPLILIEAPPQHTRWYAIVEDDNEERRERQVMRLRPFHTVIVNKGSRVLPLTRAWH